MGNTMNSVITRCVFCRQRNAVELRRLDLARCHACGHPLATPLRQALIKCPECDSATHCSVGESEPTCVHCDMLLRVNLEKCEKCGVYTTDSLIQELWHQTEESEVLLGHVCGPCGHGWRFFNCPPEGVVVGTPFYIGPISRILSKEEKAFHKLRYSGWDRWRDERLHRTNRQ